MKKKISLLTSVLTEHIRTKSPPEKIIYQE